MYLTVSCLLARPRAASALTVQDAVNTWLADACQAGARIITGALLALLS